MYEPDEVRISKSHHQLLAEAGDRLAVILSVNLDASAIVGVHAFHEYEDTTVVESCHPNPRMDRVDSYHKLLTYYGDGADIIRKHFQDIIEQQKHSDDETRFAWELVDGTDPVTSDTDLEETLSTVIGPERLEPPFEVPADEPVAKISVGAEQHDIIKQSNDRYGYAAVTIEKFRGETYIIGLTEERARTIANGCFKLKQEFSDMDMHESAQAADKAESIVHDAGEEATHPPAAD